MFFTRLMYLRKKHLYLMMTFPQALLLLLLLLLKRGRRCKSGKEQFTACQSEDPSHTIPTYRKKEGQGKTVEDIDLASSLDQ